MRNLLLLILLTFISLNKSYASDYIYVIDPSTWSNQYYGYISNAEVDVTQVGHFARVELTFNINIDSQYTYYGDKPNYTLRNLEAQLHFSMPNKSYFYDSYLWLDNSTIIRAEIMGNSQATQIYDSIVNRRIDPSILRKNYTNDYSLFVYPIATNFKRKVKICYSIPLIEMSDKKMKIELPDFIFNKAKNGSNTKITINKSTFGNYDGFSKNLNGIKTNETSKKIEFNVSFIESNDTKFILFNESNPNPVSFKYEQVNDEFGFYEVRILGSRLNGFDIKKSTNIFNIDLKYLNGFPFNVTNNCNDLLGKDSTFIEAGQYYGKIDFSKKIALDYIIDSKPYHIEYQISPTDSGKYIHQNFTSLYCERNENQYSYEYSIKSRVLNNQTAFIALEDGDTVTSSGTDYYYYNYDNAAGGFTGSIINNSDPISINVYPNPFVDIITVKSESPIKSIKISNIIGQTIFEKHYRGKEDEIKINLSELNLNNGIYYISIETNGGVKSIPIVRNQ